MKPIRSPSTVPFTLLLLPAALWSCSAREPIFPPVEPPLVWPAAGDPGRFAYVGKISSPADLKPSRSMWDWLATIVGGEGSTVGLQAPSCVAVTPANVLYVTDCGARAVHRFDMENRSYQAFTAAGDGRSFVAPIGLALLGERPVVADRSLHTLTVLSPDGTPEAVLGRQLLLSPVGVAVGPLTSRFFVVDVAAHQIKVLASDGSLLFTVGGRGRGPGEFNYPTHIACDAQENFYVSDSLNFRVQVFDRDGRFLRSWGQKGDAPGDFSQPKGIAVDPRGMVYVVDSNFENIQVFDGSGQLLLAIGEEGRGPGQFWLPTGIFTDGQDRIWVGDWFNQRVQVFRYMGGERSGGGK